MLWRDSLLCNGEAESTLQLSTSLMFRPLMPPRFFPTPLPPRGRLGDPFLLGFRSTLVAGDGTVAGRGKYFWSS